MVITALYVISFSCYLIHTTLSVTYHVKHHSTHLTMKHGYWKITFSRVPNVYTITEYVCRETKVAPNTMYHAAVTKYMPHYNQIKTHGCFTIPKILTVRFQTSLIAVIATIWLHEILPRCR